MSDFISKPYLYPFNAPYLHRLDPNNIPESLRESSTAENYFDLFDEIINQAIFPTSMLMGLIGFRPSYVVIYNGLDGSLTDIPCFDVGKNQIFFAKAEKWIGEQHIESLSSGIVVLLALHGIRPMEDNPAAESIWSYIDQENFGLDQVGPDRQKALIFRFSDFQEFAFGDTPTKKGDGPELTSKLTGAVKELNENIAKRLCTLIPETGIIEFIRNGQLGLISAFDCEKWLVYDVSVIGNNDCKSCFLKSAATIWEYITSSREHLISFIFGEWEGDPGDLITDEKLRPNVNYLDPNKPIRGLPISKLYMRANADNKSPAIDLSNIVKHVGFVTPWGAEHITLSRFIWLLHESLINVIPDGRRSLVSDTLLSGLPRMKNFPESIQLDPMIEVTFQTAISNIEPDVQETAVPYYFAYDGLGNDMIFAEDATIGPPASEVEKGAHVSPPLRILGPSVTPFGYVHNHPIRYENKATRDLKHLPSGIEFIDVDNGYKGDLSWFLNGEYALHPFFMLVAQISRENLNYVLAYRKPIAIADIPSVREHRNQIDETYTATIMDELFGDKGAVYKASIKIETSPKKPWGRYFEWPGGTVLQRVEPGSVKVKIKYR